MLTPDQEKWLAHHSDQDRITILPFDPSTPQKFEAVKRKIHPHKIECSFFEMSEYSQQLYGKVL